MIQSLNTRLVVLGVSLAFTSCGHRFTTEKFNKLGLPGFRTEREIVALLGPGSEVKDAYAEMTIAAHKLPSSARILRYADPAQPGVFYHAVLVDGVLVEQDVWDSRKKP